MCTCFLKYPAHFPTSPHRNGTAQDSVKCLVMSWFVWGGRPRKHPTATKYDFCFAQFTCLRFWGNDSKGCCVSDDVEQHISIILLRLLSPFHSLPLLYVFFSHTLAKCFFNIVGFVDYFSLPLSSVIFLSYLDPWVQYIYMNIIWL